MTDPSKAASSHPRLSAVVTALERLTRTAEGTGVGRPELEAARQFLEYKIYAVHEWAAKLRDAVRDEIVTMIPVRDEVSEFPFTVSVHRDQAFVLHLILDAYLFSAGSVRDALLQLVNVAFQLGIGQDDVHMRQKVRVALQVTPSSRTGLERWVLHPRPKRYGWLVELDRLRNITTHRRVVQVQPLIERKGDTWTGIPLIEVREHLMENVDSWSARVEDRLYRLVAHSLRQLTRTLRLRASK